MRVKWHLITHVTEEGLIQLVNDLSEWCYRNRESWSHSPTFKILKSKDFGPYQVNVLSREWDGMLRDRVHTDAESRYKSVAE